MRPLTRSGRFSRERPVGGKGARGVLAGAAAGHGERSHGGRLPVGAARSQPYLFHLPKAADEACANAMRVRYPQTLETPYPPTWGGERGGRSPVVARTRLTHAPPLHIPNPPASLARRRHVFCQTCLHEWLPQKTQCPECRAPVKASDMVCDRFAERLISNLQGFCQFRKQGCLWVGARGDMTSHLARDCPCVTVCCPNDGCGKELLRRDLWKHMESECCVAVKCECPWGCGHRCPAPEMEARAPAPLPHAPTLELARPPRAGA